MGDRICNWLATEFPGMCRWVGGMGEWEAVAFAVGLIVFGYLVYVAVYNAYLTAIGYEEPEAPAAYSWVDADYYER